MKHGLLIALLPLSGCSTLSDLAERHPVATTAIAGVVITSAALSVAKARHEQNRLPEISTPLVTCNGELCK